MSPDTVSLRVDRLVRSRYQRTVSAQTPEQILKEHDLRVTAPRLAVLKALSGAHPVVTMEEIHQKCGLKKIDFATVYRSIQTFLELGIVESVELGDGSIRYELCNADDEASSSSSSRRMRAL